MSALSEVSLCSTCQVGVGETPLTSQLCWRRQSTRTLVLSCWTVRWRRGEGGRERGEGGRTLYSVIGQRGVEEVGEGGREGGGIGRGRREGGGIGRGRREGGGIGRGRREGGGIGRGGGKEEG